MRIVVTGSSGLLGGYLVHALRERGDDVIAVGGPTREGGVDLGDPSAVEALAARTKPDAVVHAAALSLMSDCARDPAAAKRLNTDGTAHVARAFAGARLVHVSTDLVFDGESPPYAEDAAPRPLSVYGRTKLDAEAAALAAPNAVVVRVALLFGPTRTARRGFFDTQVEALRAGKSVTLFDDEWRTPLSLRAAAEVLVTLAGADVRGVLHAGGPERMSRVEMGERLAKLLGIASPAITTASRTIVPGEPRPRDVSLDSTRLHAAFPSLARATFEDECRAMLG